MLTTNKIKWYCICQGKDFIDIKYNDLVYESIVIMSFDVYQMIGFVIYILWNLTQVKVYQQTLMNRFYMLLCTAGRNSNQNRIEIYILYAL